MKIEKILKDNYSRLDKCVIEILKDINNIKLSRDEVIENIKNGNVLLNNRKAKPSQKVTINDVVTFDLSNDIQKKDQEEYKVSQDSINDFKSRIIFEDEYIIVFNKKKGEIVHDGNNTKLTLEKILNSIYNNLPGEQGRKGIVHRLDKDTSGLIIFAKEGTAYINLVNMFKNKEITKKYYAILRGILEENAYIDLPIARSQNQRHKMEVSKFGKEAKTRIKVIEVLGNNTLVDVEIYTGRTHQIRVHSAYIKHPVIGDNIYSNGKNEYGIDGQVLQSYYLEFIHPITKKLKKFKLDYYNEIKEILEKDGKR